MRKCISTGYIDGFTLVYKDKVFHCLGFDFFYRVKMKPKVRKDVCLGFE